MPSCKKIGAFSAFLGKSIVAFALYFAVLFTINFTITSFGHVFIRGLICDDFISQATGLGLKDTLGWFVAWFSFSAVLGLVLCILAPSYAEAEWKKFKSV